MRQSGGAVNCTLTLRCLSSCSPHPQAYIVERLGKYHATLDPGFHFLIPFLDKVAYVQSLKEEAVPIPGQTAITRDNVTLQIDGVLYIRTLDPYAASYGVEDAVYALVQLAQTTMRSELGKITLDKTFEERESLNHAIVQSINGAAQNWGVEVLRYEIREWRSGQDPCTLRRTGR